MAIRGSGGLGSGALSIITLKQYGFFIRYIDRLSGTRSHTLRARSPFQDPLSQLLGHSLWTRLVGSFDFSFQFLPDLTIFLFHVLKFFFDIRTMTKLDRAQRSCLSHKWVCNSHHRVSVVTELCYHSNHGTTSLRSYPIQTTHPALRASWLTTSTSTTDNVLASSPKGGPTVQGSSSESKETQRYSTVHPEDCTDWKRLLGLTRKRRLYDTKSVNGNFQDVARLHIPATKRNQYDTCTLKNLICPWSP